MVGVIDLLRERVETQSLPQQRNDSYQLALCLEGGTMRGVAVSAMSSVLFESGLLDCFDHVYGTSTGALAGAYLLGGNPRTGLSAAYEELASRHFINPLFLPIGRAANHDYLWDVVIARHKQMRFSSLCSNPIKLHPLIAAGNSTTAVDANTIANLQQVDEMIWALRAASRVPIAGGTPLTHHADIYWDAGLREAFPWKTPKLQGITHVLLLRSYPAGQPVVSSQGARATQWTHRLLQRFNIATYAQQQAELHAHVSSQCTPFVEEIRPYGPHIRSGEINRERVYRYATYAEQAMREWIEALYSSER